MNKLLILFLCVVFVTGCKKDPVTAPEEFNSPPFVAKAVYVLNEGNYGDPSGARLTLYNYDSKVVYKDVFENTTSGGHLGSVGDDMKIVGDKMYVLMSASNKIMVIRLEDYKLVDSARFPSLSPHDLIVDSLRHHLFFTNLYGGSVSVLNDSTLAIINSISVGANPQGLAIAGNRLYVCNSGYGADSTVSVIDLVSLLKESTLVLSKGPTCAAVSSDGKVLISCSGDSTTKGSVFIINPLDNSIQRKVEFATNLFYDSGTMVTDKSGAAFVIGVDPTSYYGGPVHKIGVATGSVTLNYRPGTFYGLGFNAYTNELYVANAKNFVSSGVVSIVRPDGTLKDSFTAQVGPSTFAFRWQ